MSRRYDVQQVCNNGHKITGRYVERPEDRQKRCPNCGEITTVACPNCGKEIRGDRIEEELNGCIESVKRVRVPSYCANCGKPYPWTERKIRAAIQTFAEFGNLDESEKKTIDQDVVNIARDVPEAELSARRIKRIWEKCSRAGYEVIMELASRTAAKILKAP